MKFSICNFKLIALVLFGFLSSQAQNVGVGTTEPTSNLHLKSNLVEIVEINDNFEDAMILPPYPEFPGTWTIQSAEVYTGIFAIKGPTILNGNQRTKISYPVSIPKGKVVHFQCFYRINESNISIQIDFNNNQIAEYYSNSTDWIFMDEPVTTSEPIDSIHIVIQNGPLTSINPDFYVDDVYVKYSEGHGLRIEDGGEMEGALLASDGAGNVRWQDITSLYRDTLEDNEIQLLSISNTDLSISEGNTVDLGQFNQTLDFSEGSLSITDGNSVNIGALKYSNSSLALQSNWRTEFGLESSADGYISTAWGSSTDATGFASTSWGENSEASGSYSTAWGRSTLASGQFSTAFGDNSDALGEMATAFGYDSHSIGNRSFTAGTQLRAHSYQETVFGRYSHNYTGANSSGWLGSDPLFIIGNGSSNTNRNNALTILKNGKLGLNKTDPSYIFDIEATGNDRIRMKSTGGTVDLALDGKYGINALEYLIDGSFRASIGWDNVNNRMFCYQSTNVWYVEGGQMGIKRGNPSYDLHMQNNSAAKPTSSSWTVASDARLKTNVKSFNEGLNLIMEINPVWFSYTGEAGLPQESGVGTLAQELEKIAPFMVSEWEFEDESGLKTDYKAVDYGAMDFILVNAIKELKAEIELLKLENEKLKKRMEEDRE